MTQPDLDQTHASEAISTSNATIIHLNATENMWKTHNFKIQPSRGKGENPSTFRILSLGAPNLREQDTQKNHMSKASSGRRIKFNKLLHYLSARPLISSIIIIGNNIQTSLPVVKKQRTVEEQHPASKYKRRKEFLGEIIFCPGCGGTKRKNWNRNAVFSYLLDLGV